MAVKSFVSMLERFLISAANTSSVTKLCFQMLVFPDMTIVFMLKAKVVIHFMWEEWKSFFNVLLTFHWKFFNWKLKALLFTQWKQHPKFKSENLSQESVIKNQFQLKTFKPHFDLKIFRTLVSYNNSKDPWFGLCLNSTL